MDLEATRIVWIDVESTGLDPHDGHKLLQVASIVTDGNLKEIGNPFMSKIYYSPEEAERLRDSANDYVRAMHDATGLWQTLSREGAPLRGVETTWLQHFKECGVEEGQARLGGNSITLDRNFLNAYMPRVQTYLHYRSIDMTSVGGFFEMYRKDVPQFEKAKTHDALDDIRESLAEARHYRHELSILEPGMTVYGE